MPRKMPTVEELEEFYDQLQGPLGTALRATGVILERKMRTAGVTWADLSDREVADLFMAAFDDAAPKAY